MKQKSLNILLLLFTVFCFSTCTKFGKNITVEGRVINPITNEPYGGIEVRLLRSQNLKYEGGYKAIKSTTTDENGHFELSAGRLGSVWIVTDYNYKDYYDLGWDYDGKYYSQLKVNKGEVMHVDYHLVPYGKLNLDIKNVNCEGVSDSLTYHSWSQISSGGGGYDFVNSRTGCVNFDGGTTPYASIFMGWQYIEWEANKPSGVTHGRDSVYLDKDEYGTLNVLY